MYGHLVKEFQDDPFRFRLKDPEGFSFLVSNAKRKDDPEIMTLLVKHFGVRTMRSDDGNYASSFDPITGTLVSEVTKPRGHSRYDRKQVRSPSPETVDICITDYCPVGCSYCYQDSRKDRPHGPTDLVEKTLRGFTHLPYQIAIGGGEPVFHPDFPKILETARKIGTVPNYTTSGVGMKPEVIEATNLYCGGVAMTYHAFKGLPWFVKHYGKLRDALSVQLNVHLIADVDVAENLRALRSAIGDIGPLNLVLLAYYPEVGRADNSRVMPKAVYQDVLPQEIQKAMEAGYSIAFSEGLLPYFLSRPEIGVDTSFASCSEGLFSCYVDPEGRMAKSSFDKRWVRRQEEKDATEDSSVRPEWYDLDIFQYTSQEVWEEMGGHWNLGRNEPRSGICRRCPRVEDCSSPNDTHILSCAKQPHNQRKP